MSCISCICISCSKYSVAKQGSLSLISALDKPYSVMMVFSISVATIAVIDCRHYMVVNFDV